MGTVISISKNVAAVVSEWVNAARTFTAYDVTEELRDRYPDISVYHSVVRPAVHALMTHVVANGSYQVDLKRFPSGSAYEYSPRRNAQMIDVISSVIEAIGYDTENNVLLVQIRGEVYEYRDMSATVFAEFLNAESKGRFFNERIKGSFS